MTHLRSLSRRCVLTALIGVMAIATGVASPVGIGQSPQDPFEPANRKIFAFNQWVDHHAIRPVTKAYHAVLPQPVRGSIGGVLAELGYTSVIVNDALQGDAADLIHDTVRFAVNGTIGLAGLWDPATHMGLLSHSADFGQTLARYGVPPGPYLMLPVIGPEVLRDVPSEFVDRFTSVDWHLKNGGSKVGLPVAHVINRRDELLPADAAVDNAFDPYRSVRDAYLQKRLYRNGGNPAGDSDELPPLDDLDPDQDGAP